MNTNLLLRAFVSAAGVAGYVSAFAWLLNHTERGFDGQPDFLIGTLMILLFIISASVTGSLVLLRPVTMFMDGNKKGAMQLFVYTIAFLAAIAIAVALTLTQYEAGAQCTLEAMLCPDGSYVGRAGPNCEFSPCPGR